MSSGKYSGFSDLAKQALMQPQESMLEVKNKKNRLYIGIPKEVTFQENRIPLTPLSVALLVNNGHEVVLESNAGQAANFSDKDYAEQGAQIVYDTKKVYEADIIIKIAPPTLAEIEMMKPGQKLISALQLLTLKAESVQALLNKKVTALCFEHLRDEGGSLSVVRAMSEIVGATSILIAGEYLSNVFDGKGLMLGGITGGEQRFQLARFLFAHEIFLTDENDGFVGAQSKFAVYPAGQSSTRFAFAKATKDFRFGRD